MEIMTNSPDECNNNNRKYQQKDGAISSDEETDFSDMADNLVIAEDNEVK